MLTKKDLTQEKKSVSDSTLNKITTKEDFWPWMLTLVTVIFIGTIVIFEDFFIDNTWAAFLLMGLFVGCGLYVLWRFFTSESR